MNWTEYLTAEERARLDELKLIRRQAREEYRRIYDRGRKRMQRPNKTGNGKQVENAARKGA